MGNDSVSMEKSDREDKELARRKHEIYLDERRLYLDREAAPQALS